MFAVFIEGKRLDGEFTEDDAQDKLSKLMCKGCSVSFFVGQWDMDGCCTYVDVNSETCPSCCDAWADKETLTCDNPMCILAASQLDTLIVILQEGGE